MLGTAVLLLAVLTPGAVMAEPEPLTVETEVEPVSGTVLAVPDEATAPAEASPMDLPRHGMSMAEVERHYGAPKEKHAAVGKPPITRWDYDGFSVFFEYHTVLHAVRPDAPAPIQRRDELIGGKAAEMPTPVPEDTNPPAETP
jgi:hypothetical protein